MSAENPTLTSANSVITLTIPGLYNAPVTLSGFSTDRAWDTGSVTLAVNLMGVDGKKSSGYTPAMVQQTYTLQADSKSKQVFKDLLNATFAAKEVYRIEGTIDIPATGESFILSNGTLTEAKTIPDAHNILQPMDFVITWESILPTLS